MKNFLKVETVSKMETLAGANLHEASAEAVKYAIVNNVAVEFEFNENLYSFDPSKQNFTILCKVREKEKK